MLRLGDWCLHRLSLTIELLHAPCLSNVPALCHPPSSNNVHILHFPHENHSQHCECNRCLSGCWSRHQHNNFENGENLLKLCSAWPLPCQYITPNAPSILALTLKLLPIRFYQHLTNGKCIHIRQLIACVRWATPHACLHPYAGEHTHRTATLAISTCRSFPFLCFCVFLRLWASTKSMAFTQFCANPHLIQTPTQPPLYFCCCHISFHHEASKWIRTQPRTSYIHKTEMISWMIHERVQSAQHRLS